LYIDVVKPAAAGYQGLFYFCHIKTQSACQGKIPDRRFVLGKLNNFFFI